MHERRKGGPGEYAIEGGEGGGICESGAREREEGKESVIGVFYIRDS